MKSITFLKNFFEPIFLDKVTALKVFTYGLIENMLTVIIPLYFIPKIVGLLDEGQNILAFRYSMIGLVLFTVLFLLRNKYMYYWFWAINVPFEKVLNKKYLPIALMIDSKIFDNHGTGYHLSKYSEGIRASGMNSREFLYSFPSIILNLVVSSFIVFRFGINVGIVFTLVVIVCILLAGYIYKGESNLLEESSEMRNQISGDVGRIIMSKQEIIFSDKIEKETESVVRQKQKLFESEKKALNYSIGKLGLIWYLPIYAMLTLFVIQTLGYVYFSAKDIALIVLLGNTLTNSVNDIFRTMGSIFDNYNPVTLFLKMVNEKKIKNYNTGVSFVHGTGEIDLQDVTFSYDKEKVLENFNLKIKGKTKVALVGKSGSGKTTIAKLVSGYLKIEDYNTGKVLIDGQNINNLSLKSYYKYIGYLTQEPMVFDGSIRENLMYAVDEKNISEDMINNTLIKAKCDFVFTLKNGLDTQIGEKGIRLSGGERQRLAIAKLFLKNPEIIILDEPTSALDSFSEEIISQSLDELFKDRTVIIIAHRLQTVKKADEIIVLENGKILERGKHESLITLHGNYAKMLELQSGF